MMIAPGVKDPDQRRKKTEQQSETETEVEDHDQPIRVESQGHVLEKGGKGLISQDLEVVKG